jgi:hypothetical protein
VSAWPLDDEPSWAVVVDVVELLVVELLVLDAAVVVGAAVAAVVAVVVAVVEVVTVPSASATVWPIQRPSVPATNAAPLRAAVATRDRAAGCRRRRRPGGGVEVPVGEDHGGWTSPALMGSILTVEPGSNL